MQKTSLKEQTVEQLKATKKAYTAMLIIESLVIAAFIVYFLYKYTTDSWNHGLIIVIIPFILMAGMIPIFMMRQAIINELDTRK